MKNRTFSTYWLTLCSYSPLPFPVLRVVPGHLRHRTNFLALSHCVLAKKNSEEWLKNDSKRQKVEIYIFLKLCMLFNEFFFCEAQFDVTFSTPCGVIFIGVIYEISSFVKSFFKRKNTQFCEATKWKCSSTPYLHVTVYWKNERCMVKPSKGRLRKKITGTYF